MNQGIVFVSGKFNILHPGHLRLLRFAKGFGKRLVVAIESDSLAGADAHVPELLRLEGIQSNSLVDESFIATDPVTDIIARLRPDVVVKGKEHELRFNPELSVLEQYGGKLLFSSGEAIFSSVDLIHKEFQKREARSISLPHDYMARHAITVGRIQNLLTQFSQLNVCVVGDLIIDEYITCEPLGMSQEDPTIVVTPVDSTRFIGGAGIVAAHAACLGAAVQFFTVTGEDATRDFALASLQSIPVAMHAHVDSSRPTTLKQRYRAKGKSLLRVSHLHQGAVSAEIQAKILSQIELAMNVADLLVFSDFNYGCLPQPLVDHLVQRRQ